MHGFVMEVTGVCGGLSISEWNDLIVHGVCGGHKCHVLVDVCVFMECSD